MDAHAFTPYVPLGYSATETEARATAFANLMQQRRSVRHFSPEPVPRVVIEAILHTANAAPSGANKQPWTFVAVQDAEVKKQIRTAAEAEEYQNYHGRMPAEWLNDIAHLGTDWHKAFLEVAHWLIVAFRQVHGVDANGQKTKHYYTQESIGLACGFLIAAIQNAGLITLTHTPSPLDFLQRVLNRPANEKGFLLLPVGYPASDAVVPVQPRKGLADTVVWI